MVFMTRKFRLLGFWYAHSLSLFPGCLLVLIFYLFFSRKKHSSVFLLDWQPAWRPQPLDPIGSVLFCMEWVWQISSCPWQSWGSVISWGPLISFCMGCQEGDRQIDLKLSKGRLALSDWRGSSLDTWNRATFGWGSVVICGMYRLKQRRNLAVSFFLVLLCWWSE